MKEDRFLTGILIVIALLVAASLSVFFLRQDAATYLSEDTPEGIVHNYVYAIQQGHYEKAYDYLADKENKPSYDEFRQDLFLDQNSGQGIQIGEVEIGKDTASVEIAITENRGELFFKQYSYSDAALLIMQDGEWKIFQMHFSYWSWNWYQDEN